MTLKRTFVYLNRSLRNNKLHLNSGYFKETLGYDLTSLFHNLYIYYIIVIIIMVV